MGIDCGQGYLFSRPVPHDEFISMVESRWNGFGSRAPDQDSRKGVILGRKLAN